jgi:hypothetical protein
MVRKTENSAGSTIMPHSIRFALATAVLLSAFPLAAQMLPESDAPSLPSYGDDLTEGGRLQVSGELGAAYTDNFFNRRTDPDTAWGVIFKPGARYTYAVPRFLFGAGASAEYGKYSISNDQGGDDSYVDALGSLGLGWVAAANHRFDWGADLQIDHDPFGTARTEVNTGQRGELDKWRREAFDMKYTYGQSARRFNAEFRLGTQDKEYTSNEQFTRFLNYQRVGSEMTLFYNFGARTSALFDVIGLRTRYDDVINPLFDRSSNEMRYRIGARWVATAKTTGDVRIGLVDRRPTVPGREDFQKVDWQVAFGWTPRSFAQLNLQTGRHSQESFIPDTVDFINNQYYTAEFIYDWTSTFNTSANASFINAEFVGSPRRDKVYSGGIAADYRATPSISVLGNVGYTDRTTNAQFLDYNKLSAYVGIRYVR